ncbi:MAG: type IV pilus modification protein PilV [Pseudomonadota bacterium]
MMQLYLSKQRGFTLFEVLVAVVVFSIGLIGLASLQGYSMSSSYNAHLRTQATALASSIVDRMRANRDQAVNDNAYKTDFAANPPNTSIDCSTGCTPEQMAQMDLLEWKCNLGSYSQETFCNGLVTQSTLPNGDGEIKDIANGQIEVTVRWSDSLGDEHTVVLFTGL